MTDQVSNALESNLLNEELSRIVPYCVFDTSGRITDVNSLFIERYQIDKPLLGSSFLSLIPRDYYQTLDRLISDLTEATPEVELDAPNVENALCKYTNWTFKAFFDSGVVEHVLVVAYDITKSKQAEERLRRSIDTEYVLSVILSSFINVRAAGIDDEIENALHLLSEFFHIDRCSIFSVNDKVLIKKNSWTAPESIAFFKKPHSSFLFDSSSEVFQRLFAGEVLCFSHGSEEIEYIKEVFLSESLKTVLLIPMLLKNKAIGVILFEMCHIAELWEVENISRLKAVAEVFVSVWSRIGSEKQIQKHEKLLMQADRLSSLGTLVAGVAHEINNPLTLITMSTPILLEAWKEILPILEDYYRKNGDFEIAGLSYSEAKEDIPELCSNISIGGERIENIVIDLKDFARDQVDESVELLSMNDVIASSIKMTRKSIDNATAHFSVELDTSIPPVRGSGQKLQQVIINLIINACNALTSKKQCLDISSSYNKVDSVVVVKIYDEGCGIEKENLSKIFDPFFTTNGDCGGTGLGLSISHTILQQHHANLTYESKSGEWTCAAVAIPAVLDL